MIREDLKQAKTLNEKIAVIGTALFSSIITFYLFFIYGLAPLVWPHAQSTLLYWSNDIQLWALPLLGVGTVVVNRLVTRKADETHDTVMQAHTEQLAFIAEMHQEHTEQLESFTRQHDEQLAEHKELLDAIHERLKTL